MLESLALERNAAISAAAADGRGVALLQGPLTEGDSVYIHECVNVVLQICRLYGFDQKGYNPLKACRRWEVSAFQCDSLMAFVKYKLNAFYSACLSSEQEDQEIVPSPKLKLGDGELPDLASKLLTGKAGRWLDMLRKRSEGFVDPEGLSPARALSESLILSLGNGKKGMPRPTTSQLRTAEQETFESLTHPRQDGETRLLLCSTMKCDFVKTSDHLDWQSVEQELRRTVREIYHGETMKGEDYLYPFVPSSNAHNNMPRQSGGALGGIFYDPDFSLEGIPTDNLLVEVKTRGTGKRQCLPVTEFDMSGLQTSFGELYRRILSAAIGGIPLAKFLALPEALKIRVISTGPAMLYTALKPLQRKLWSVMSRHPCFHLTGAPITAQHVQERLGKVLPPNHSFLSVDYKNATNEIHSKCSEIVCDELSKVLGLEPVLAHLFRLSLTGHQLINKATGEVLPQANGQLMGSVTSFPVLCIINAALCRWALELTNTGQFAAYLPLSKAKLCVNGDDAVMVANTYTQDVWERVTSFCGLVKSIGKVYFSRHFLNMNSATFYYSPSCWTLEERKDFSLIEMHYRQVGYINFGLLFGLTRSGMQSDEVRDGTIGSRARELIEGTPDIYVSPYGERPGYFLRERVLSQFIARNSGELKRFRIPWFIPETFGGLGLPIVGKFTPRPLDLRLCRKIYERYRLPPKFSEGTSKYWAMAQRLVREPTCLEILRVQEFTCTAGLDGQLVTYKELVAKAVVSVLFKQARTGYPPEDIAADFAHLPYHVGLSTSDPFYKRLERLWNRAMTDRISYPEPYGVVGNVIQLPPLYNIHDIPVFFLTSCHVALDDHPPISNRPGKKRVNPSSVHALPVLWE